MNNGNKWRPRLVLFFFIAQVFINWLYILWIKALPGIVINSWFVVLPLMGYFYFAFALIASIGLYYRKQPGLSLAYAVIMFGAMACVISYNVVYGKNFLVEQFIIPVITFNFCIVLYMAFNQRYFQGE